MPQFPARPGMAGAFVAVADDATAVYWIPAGVGTGSIVSVVLDAGLPTGLGALAKYSK